MNEYMDEELIVLTDEDGVEVTFEILDIIEYRGEEYAVLYPVDDDEDDLVHILHIISDDLDSDETQLEGIDDTKLIDTIYQIYRKQNGI